MGRGWRRLFGRGAGDGAPDPPTWADRARDAQAALLRHFATGDGAHFRERAPALPTDRRYAYLWPFGQGWMAALDLARHLGDGAALALAGRLRQTFFAHYWDTAARPPGGAAYPITDGGGDRYYDDNAWIGLALVRLAELTGDRAALADAARVFAYVASGWDDDPRHPAPGGLFWTDMATNDDRNTCANGPGAQLGLALAAATGDREALAAARRMVAWVGATLRDPADGLYWDHITPDGAIERTKWSYNQGAMIGAAAQLAQIDGDPAALEGARAVALAAGAFYAEGDRLWAQDPAFNAIFFDNLFLLGAALGAHDWYRPLLDGYLSRAWAGGRDRRTALWHFGRGGRVDLLTQAAAVRLCALRAGLAARSPIIAPDDTGRGPGGRDGGGRGR